MPEPNLTGWKDVPKQPESLEGQRELFTTGRELPKRARKDYERGQDFLFTLDDGGPSDDRTTT